MVFWPSTFYLFILTTAYHRGSVCASHPAIPGSILGVPDFFKFDVADIYRERHCLERVDSAKSFISYSTNLVLVSGKLVQQQKVLLPGTKLGKYLPLNGAVVVAQLVEWSLPTPEICGSNPVIGKILSTNCAIKYKAEENKEKEARNGQSLKKYSSLWAAVTIYNLIWQWKQAILMDMNLRLMCSAEVM